MIELITQSTSAVSCLGIFAIYMRVNILTQSQKNTETQLNKMENEITRLVTLEKNGQIQLTRLEGEIHSITHVQKNIDNQITKLEAEIIGIKKDYLQRDQFLETLKRIEQQLEIYRLTTRNEK